MKKLYSSQNRVNIYLFQAALESKNIACFIKNENPPLAGEIPSIVAWPELWCMNDEQYPEAKKIIAAELNRLHTKQQPWVCTQCNEHLDGQFDLCWKCGATRV